MGELIGYNQTAVDAMSSEGRPRRTRKGALVATGALALASLMGCDIKRNGGTPTESAPAPTPTSEVFYDTSGDLQRAFDASGEDGEVNARKVEEAIEHASEEAVTDYVDEKAREGQVTVINNINFDGRTVVKALEEAGVIEYVRDTFTAQTSDGKEIRVYCNEIGAERPKEGSKCAQVVIDGKAYDVYICQRDAQPVVPCNPGDCEEPDPKATPTDKPATATNTPDGSTATPTPKPDSSATPTSKPGDTPTSVPPTATSVPPTPTSVPPTAAPSHTPRPSATTEATGTAVPPTATEDPTEEPPFTIQLYASRDVSPHSPSTVGTFAVDVPDGMIGAASGLYDGWKFQEPNNFVNAFDLLRSGRPRQEGISDRPTIAEGMSVHADEVLRNFIEDAVAYCTPGTTAADIAAEIGMTPAQLLEFLSIVGTVCLGDNDDTSVTIRSIDPRVPGFAMNGPEDTPRGRLDGYRSAEQPWHNPNALPGRTGIAPGPALVEEATVWREDLYGARPYERPWTWRDARSAAHGEGGFRQVTGMPVRDFLRLIRNVAGVGSRGTGIEVRVEP